jgi:hypothetical protein
MGGIYVSGPVIRSSAQWDVVPWVQQAYESVGDAARRNESKAVLPHVDGDLQR